MPKENAQSDPNAEPTENTTPDDGDEIGAGFDDAVSSFEGTQSDNKGPVPGEDDDDQGDPPADTSAQGEDDDADDGADDQPPARQDGSDPSQPDDPSNDIWANAPPALREAHEKALRDKDLTARTWEGRARAFQRQLTERPQQPQNPPQQDEQQSQRQPDSNAEDKGGKKPLSKEQLDQLREDYPDLAGPFLDLVEQQQAEIARLTEGYGAVEQDRTARHVQEQEGILNSAHPDWQKALGDERFGGWLEGQPNAVRAAFEKNLDAIVDGNDAAFVVEKFKRDVGFATPQQQDPPKGQRQQDRQDDNPKPKDDRRERQLKSGKDAGRTGPNVTNELPDDVEAAANHYADSLDRQAARR